MKRSSLAALAVATAVTVVVAASALYALAQSPATGTGLLVGQLDIGPFCPVQPIAGCPPPAGTYSSREVTAQPRSGSPVYIAINSTGGFSASLPAGTYTLGLTNCTFAGCGSSLPVTVVVDANRTSFVNVTIDTGIR